MLSKCYPWKFSFKLYWNYLQILQNYCIILITGPSCKSGSISSYENYSWYHMPTYDFERIKTLIVWNGARLSGGPIIRIQQYTMRAYLIFKLSKRKCLTSWHGQFTESIKQATDPRLSKFPNHFQYLYLH